MGNGVREQHVPAPLGQPCPALQVSHHGQEAFPVVLQLQASRIVLELQRQHETQNAMSTGGGVSAACLGAWGT